MPKATWKFDHYELTDNEFVHLGEVITPTKKSGYLQRDLQNNRERRTFNVVHNLLTGHIGIDQYTGSWADADRLMQLVITGTDPGEMAAYTTSRYSVVLSGEWPFGVVLLFQAREEKTTEEWSEISVRARNRYEELEVMTPPERYVLPLEEQKAFGFGLSKYMTYFFRINENITSLPVCSQKMEY